MAELFLQGPAVKYLLGIPEVVNAVGKFTVSQKPFIFRDEILANLEDGEYQAVSAIVVQDAGPLASLVLSRYRGRRLRVTIWANGTRDVSGNLIGVKSIYDKITDTFTVVDKYLHRTSAETVDWDGVKTISCDRLLDLSEPIALSEGDGIMIASAYYGVFF
jgi:hypothetical protein